MNTSQTNRIITARTSTRSETPAGPLWLQGAVQKNGRSVLELKLPPVALGAVSAVLMWSTSSAEPAFDFIFPAKAMYRESGADGCSYVPCWRGLVQTGENQVNPMKPDAASSLVVSGIYRYTRNPMYAGFLLILLGLAAFLSNVLVLVVLPAFVLYMNRFQIFPEERVLAALFADDYTEYLARVRRWF